MIRVTVEVVPFGDEDYARKIGVVTIANKTLMAELSEYEVTIDGETIPDRIAHFRSAGWPKLVGNSMAAVGYSAAESICTFLRWGAEP